MEVKDYLTSLSSQNDLRRTRIFKNVGNVAVGASVKGNNKAVIEDEFKVGYVFTITSIYIKTVVSTSLASTITVKANGTTIFTKNFLNIPALGVLTDILAGSVLPADLTLPLTFTCSATAGNYDIFISGLEN